MRKSSGSVGSISRVTIESQVLKSNMLDDSSVRVADVYAPAEHDGRGLPLLVDLVGFTGSGLSQTTIRIGLPPSPASSRMCHDDTFLRSALSSMHSNPVPARQNHFPERVFNSSQSPARVCGKSCFALLPKCEVLG